MSIRQARPLTNLNTPYVHFEFGANVMGLSADVLGDLNLPYVLFGSNVSDQPDGMTLDTAGNAQSYGATPATDGRILVAQTEHVDEIAPRRQHQCQHQ